MSGPIKPLCCRSKDSKLTGSSDYLDSSSSFGSRFSVSSDTFLKSPGSLHSGKGSRGASSTVGFSSQTLNVYTS